MEKELAITAQWPGPGHKKTVRTRMHSILILHAGLYFLTPDIFSCVNSFLELHLFFRLERICVASDVRYTCRRQRGRVVKAPNSKSGGRGFKSRSDRLAGDVFGKL